MAEIPARGDRAVWDSTNYPEKHAKDIDNSNYTYHVPAPASNDQTLKSAGGIWTLAAYDPPSDVGYYEPLTNGDASSPELIFADGDVIMVEVI